LSEAAIELRRLSPTEAPLYREIRLEGLRQDPDAFSSTFESESDQPVSLFASRLAGSSVFGAFRGPELLGIAGFVVQSGPKHAHKGTLWGMYVRPAARGAGIGRRLVEAVIDHARTQVELIQLRVVNENPTARRLYARLGFEEYGVEEHAAKYQGRYHDDVLMVKMLASDSDRSTPPSGDTNR
jgi:ribosomal protein S18 acetylase RimI-like enzyme